MEKAVFQKKNGKSEDFVISDKTARRLIVVKMKLKILGSDIIQATQAMVEENNLFSERDIVEYLNFLDNLMLWKIDLPELKETAQKLTLEDSMDKMLKDPEFRERVLKQREALKQGWEALTQRGDKK